MDFSLSENQRKWQLIAREFATKIVAPEALSRDRIPLAKDRIPWDWIKLIEDQKNDLQRADSCEVIGVKFS